MHGQFVLDSLITSKTRIKLLLKFFLNPETKAYLRSLADEFGESTNAVRIELNRMFKAGLLLSENKGRTIVYSANRRNPLFPEIHTIVKKYLGIDVVETTLKKLGKLETAFISGDYSKGIDSGIIDLVIVGDVKIDYLNTLVAIAEQNINRKIRTLILKSDEFESFKESLDYNNSFVIWNKQ